MLFLKATYDGSQATIVVDGEFDLSGAAEFWACVSEVFASPSRSVTVDTRGLTSIDVSALRNLVRTREAAAEEGLAFRISEPSPVLRRLAQLAGVEDLLTDERDTGIPGDGAAGTAGVTG